MLNTENEIMCLITWRSTWEHSFPKNIESVKHCEISHCIICQSLVLYLPWPVYYSGHEKPSLQWRHNERDGVSNHQPHDCLLNGLFKPQIKETSKLRVTGLCEGKSPGTGEFPAQRVSNAENVSIWWRHHDVSHSNQHSNADSPLGNIPSRVSLEVSQWSRQFSTYRHLFKLNFTKTTITLFPSKTSTNATEKWFQW